MVLIGCYLKRRRFSTACNSMHRDLSGVARKLNRRSNKAYFSQAIRVQEKLVASPWSELSHCGFPISFGIV
jgi:hypothetical protein